MASGLTAHAAPHATGKRRHATVRGTTGYRRRETHRHGSNGGLVNPLAASLQEE
jgi:hypothetical protein